jgi:hypothetical protein
MPRTVRGVSFLIVILCVAFLLGCVVTGLVFWQHSRKAAAESARTAVRAMSAEQQAYCTSLEFSDLRMSAAENFLGATVTYLDGRVANRGTRTLSQLQVELNFVDILNQVVLRETAYPVSKAAPLQPGAVRTFRVTFEHMPLDWNQAQPTIKPTRIEF